MSQANPTDAEATAYAENYILYGDQTRAFRAAFPDSNAKPESQHQTASKFHAISKVQSRITELHEISKKHSEKEYEITIGKIKEKLIQAAEAGLHEKIDAQGNMIAHSVSGAVSALAEINKMDGNHAPTKADITGSINMQITQDESEL